MKKVIIIGAGIVGAATAYELAKRGVSVTIIDAQKDGRATAAAAGIICPWLSERRNKPWYTLATSGAAYYDTLIDQLREDGQTETGFKRVGAIRLLTDQARVDKLYDIAFARREASPEIGEILKLTQAETQAKFPFLTDDYYSLYIAGAARIDGRLLCAALLQAAEKHGATRMIGKANLIVKEGKLTGVEINQQTLLADQIIAANGAWMNELLSPLDLHFSFVKRKGQLIHLFDEKAVEQALPIVMALRNQYIIPFDKGRIVIGSTTENPTHFHTDVTVNGLHTTLDLALETAPGLSESSFVEARTGFRPYTEDFLPVFGKVPHVPNLLLANGLGASGLTTGPFIGRQLAKIILGEAADINLADYQIK